jgi:hypothetical protein
LATATATRFDRSCVRVAVVARRWTGRSAASTIRDGVFLRREAGAAWRSGDTDVIGRSATGGDTVAVASVERVRFDVVDTVEHDDADAGAVLGSSAGAPPWPSASGARRRRNQRVRGGDGNVTGVFRS